MSETEDLLAVHGAIDRAVAADPELVSVVAPYLGAYADGGAVGWFDEFVAWTLERTGGDASPLPELEAALRNMADRAPSPRAAARRLLALGVAARVFPELRDAGSPASVQGALTVNNLAGFDNDDRAAELLALLLDDEWFASMSDWPKLIEAAFDANLIPATVAMQGAAPPCGGRLVVVQNPGDLSPAAALTTEFWTDQVTLDQAMRFLEPVNWPGCCDLWCSMTETGVSAAGNPEYHEVVSLDCTQPTATWTAEADLEFRFVAMPGGARVSYDLCQGRPQPGDLIVEDSGMLAIQQEGNGIRVMTTKRIRFDHPFSGPSLAMLLCALGYATAVEDMVFGCAATSDGSAGTPFPAVSGTTQGGTVIKPGTQAQAHHAATGGQQDAAAAKAVQEAVDDAVSAAKQCIDDCVAAYTASYEKVAAGSYAADDLVNDMAKMWARLLRDAALVADLGLRATRAAAASSTAARQSHTGG